MRNKGFTPHHFFSGHQDNIFGDRKANINHRNGAGFTLIEILLYVAVLAMLILAVSSILLWAVRSTAKARAVRETNINFARAMDALASEIRTGFAIYSPTTTTSQLSLETAPPAGGPAGENSTYIDFFLCGNRLCVKREGQNPVALTSTLVEVNTLQFTEVRTGQIPSVQITLGINYKNPAGRAELASSFQTTSAVSLRGY